MEKVIKAFFFAIVITPLALLVVILLKQMFFPEMIPARASAADVRIVSGQYVCPEYLEKEGRMIGCSFWDSVTSHYLDVWFSLPYFTLALFFLPTSWPVVRTTLYLPLSFLIVFVAVLSYFRLREARISKLPRDEIRREPVGDSPTTLREIETREIHPHPGALTAAPPCSRDDTLNAYGTEKLQRKRNSKRA